MELAESVWGLHETAPCLGVEIPIVRVRGIKSLVARHGGAENENRLAFCAFPPGKHQVLSITCGEELTSFRGGGPTGALTQSLTLLTRACREFLGEF